MQLLRYGKADRFGLVALSFMTALLASVIAARRWPTYDFVTKLLAVMLVAGVMALPWRGLRSQCSDEEARKRLIVATHGCMLVLVAIVLFSLH